jgi:hypothetical protein
VGVYDLRVQYLDFLRRLHELLRPRRYLEIGVRWGNSLSLSRCPSLGIDPDFNINHELHTEVQLFKTTSDEYFSRPNPLLPMANEPFDLAFVDGLHLFEFALRDFIHAEQHSRPSAVIVFDDVLPRSVTEASRARATPGWTGDVYHLVEVLERYRPDILMVQVDTGPTGLMLLLGLNPADTTLIDHYDTIVAEHRHPDPQPVPREVLERTMVQPAVRVLESGLFEVLAAAPDDVDREGLGADLRRIAVETLGRSFEQRVTR